MIEEILKEYDKKASIHKSFTEAIEVLLKQIITDNIRINSISYRPQVIKTRKSLEDKIMRKEKNYETLNDVKDIAGIRIITYFENDVDKVAEIIESEFVIDKENTIDKRAVIDPDRFGYLSLHYVVSLNKTRLGLRENKDYKNLPAEIQIRSILQHAWAEIEHDHGYKTKNDVPRMVRRKFSQVAGLLEIADEVFIAIRKELDEYKKVVPQLIRDEPEEVLIDRISLINLVQINELIIKLDDEIAQIFNYQISDITEIGVLIETLQWLHIGSISELLRLLNKYKDHLLPFCEKYYIMQTKREETEPSGSFSPGTSLWYLCYLKVASSNDPEHVRQYLNDFRIGFELDRDALITVLIDSYKDIGEI